MKTQANSKGSTMSRHTVFMYARDRSFAGNFDVSYSMMARDEAHALELGRAYAASNGAKLHSIRARVGW